MVALNAGLEGARAGESQGRALLLLSEEIRANVVRGADAASELDRLGYTACWVPDLGGPLFEALDRLLDATTSMVVASGVCNLWHHPPEETLAWWDGLADQCRGWSFAGDEQRRGGKPVPDGV